MSQVMLWRAVKDLRLTTLWYGLGLVLYTLFLVYYFPTIRDTGDVLQQYIESFPAALIEAFGITDLTSYAGFMGAEFLNLVWPLIVSIFLIMSGTAVVAQEVERGTIEFWLSVPEERWRLLASKIVALLGSLLLLVLVTLVPLGLGANALGESLPRMSLPATGLVLLSYGIAVGGYSVLLSAVASDRSKPAGIAAGLTLGFYLLYVVGSLGDRLSWLKYISIFTAFQPQAALAEGTVPVLGVLILIAIGLACAVGSLIIFQRRDLLL